MEKNININKNIKKITVIGAGISGTALALFAHNLGMDVFVSEERDVLAPDISEKLKKSGITWEIGGHTEQAYKTDALLLSSGIPPFASCVKEAERRNLPVIGELDFVIPHIKGQIVGITGSNGKSTLTALCGHILKKAGFKVGVGGNIGDAASLFTQELFDYVVLELSSFQLYWAHNLKSTISIVTNLAPDHIDWHGSYEAYIEAKAKIISLQDKDKNNKNSWSIIQKRDYQALCHNNIINNASLIALTWDIKNNPDYISDYISNYIFMDKNAAVLRLSGDEHFLFNYSDTTLLGNHNLENVAMALATAQLLNAGVSNSISNSKYFSTKNILSDFQPLPHRCELAGIIDDVTYIDDSKGTNVAASVTAMTSIKGRKIVILGGQGKGEDYTDLAEAVKREADAAILIGEEKDRIESALISVNFNSITKVSDMENAIIKARKIAKPGMVVLLSPACTSWDMYENYKKRGEHFCAIVNNINNNYNKNISKS